MGTETDEAPAEDGNEEETDEEGELVGPIGGMVIVVVVEVVVVVLIVIGMGVLVWLKGTPDMLEADELIDTALV